jgi:hypothetical protein
MALFSHGLQHSGVHPLLSAHKIHQAAHAGNCLRRSACVSGVRRVGIGNTACSFSSNSIEVTGLSIIIRPRRQGIRRKIPHLEGTSAWAPTSLPQVRLPAKAFRQRHLELSTNPAPLPFGSCHLCFAIPLSGSTPTIALKKAEQSKRHGDDTRPQGFLSRLYETIFTFAVPRGWQRLSDQNILDERLRTHISYRMEFNSRRPAVSAKE